MGANRISMHQAMTKASAARNVRRGKDSDALKKAYEHGFRIGMVSLANQLQSPDGYKLPDGRVARIVFDAAPEGYDANGSPV